jgi:hypothetical protein
MRRSASAANMSATDATAFTIKIEPDRERPGRYRWKLLIAGQVRGQSLFSFATRRETQADADSFVQKQKMTRRNS